MDVVIMRLEELLEVKLPAQELALFKIEFESFYLVPLHILERKMIYYVGSLTPAKEPIITDELTSEGSPNYFEISLIVLLNRVLEEWERF